MKKIVLIGLALWTLQPASAWQTGDVASDPPATKEDVTRSLQEVLPYPAAKPTPKVIPAPPAVKTTEAPALVQTQDGAILVEMVDSFRMGWKTRKHFYQVRGVKHYKYRAVDNSMVTIETQIKSLPDKRTYEKRHPYECTFNRVGNYVGFASNATGLATHF